MPHNANLLAQAAPKDSALVHSLDLASAHPSLLWTIFRGSTQYHLSTPAFNIQARLNREEPAVEKFKKDQGDEGPKKLKLTFEIKGASGIHLDGAYCGGFETRKRVRDWS